MLEYIPKQQLNESSKAVIPILELGHLIVVILKGCKMIHTVEKIHKIMWSDKINYDIKFIFIFLRKTEEFFLLTTQGTIKIWKSKCTSSLKDLHFKMNLKDC